MLYAALFLTEEAKRLSFFQSLELILDEVDLLIRRASYRLIFLWAEDSIFGVEAALLLSLVFRGGHYRLMESGNRMM